MEPRWKGRVTQEHIGGKRNGWCKFVHGFVGYSEEFGFNRKGNGRLLKGFNLGCLLYGEWVAGTRMKAGRPTGQPF